MDRAVQGEGGGIFGLLDLLGRQGVEAALTFDCLDRGIRLDWLSWHELLSMVVHLPPSSRFKTTYDPDGSIAPPPDKPALTASEIRERINARFTRKESA
ncbi:hypothetical protein [Dietzia sp. MNB45]|uniref:hypothetical protein n=1 Tax=Dietzia sp. MNB45 TaxID=3238800 RepID=UPI003F80B9B6